MKNRGQILIGGLLILIGLVYIAAILFDINLHGSFWAILLIALGVWMLFRPRISKDSLDEYHIFGDITRTGHWKPENETYWMFIGDVKLNLSDVELPEGETVIRSYTFIGDMKIIAARDFPISVCSTGIIRDVNLFGQKQDAFFSTGEFKTPSYDTSPRKLRLETTALLGGLKVKEK